MVSEVIVYAVVLRLFGAAHEEPPSKNHVGYWNPRHKIIILSHDSYIMGWRLHRFVGSYVLLVPHQG